MLAAHGIGFWSLTEFSRRAAIPEQPGSSGEHEEDKQSDEEAKAGFHLGEKLVAYSARVQNILQVRFNYEPDERRRLHRCCLS